MLLLDIPYPDEVALISLGILGQGFFPGAVGSLPDLSQAGGVLMLGQDFGQTDYYDARCGDKDEACVTWTNVCATYRKTFTGQPIWFSNYLMGARKPPLPATGDLQDYIHDPDQWIRYEDACWKFLYAQVEYQRPAIIVVMGEPNRRRLSAVNRFNTGWDAFRNATSTVQACAENGLRDSKMFPLSDGSTQTSRLTYVYHPCFGQGPTKLALIANDAQRVAGYWDAYRKSLPTS